MKPVGNLILKIESFGDGYRFSLAFSCDGELYKINGTAPSLGRCFDEAMTYLDRMTREGEPV